MELLQCLKRSKISAADAAAYEPSTPLGDHDPGGTLAPEPLEEIDESVTPGGPGLYRVDRRNPHDHDRVRAKIAYSILAGLGILYAALFSGLLWFDLPLDRFTAAAAALSAPQSLAAAAVGFYYAKK